MYNPFDWDVFRGFCFSFGGNLPVIMFPAVSPMSTASLTTVRMIVSRILRLFAAGSKMNVLSVSTRSAAGTRFIVVDLGVLFFICRAWV